MKDPDLTPQQEAALRAVMNRIVPGDDFPNAWDAGVGAYVTRQLAGDLAGQVADMAAGLDSLDAEAQAGGAAGFAALDPDQQDALLTRLERAQASTVWPVDPSAFFDQLILLTIEGFYADPGNGGNRDAVSWRMIGFTGQP